MTPEELAAKYEIDILESALSYLENQKIEGRKNEMQKTNL